MGYPDIGQRRGELLSGVDGGDLTAESRGRVQCLVGVLPPQLLGVLEPEE